MLATELPAHVWELLLRWCSPLALLGYALVSHTFFEWIKRSLAGIAALEFDGDETIHVEYVGSRNPEKACHADRGFTPKLRTTSSGSVSRIQLGYAWLLRFHRSIRKSGNTEPIHLIFHRTVTCLIRHAVGLRSLSLHRWPQMNYADESVAARRFCSRDYEKTGGPQWQEKEGFQVGDLVRFRSGPGQPWQSGKVEQVVDKRPQMSNGDGGDLRFWEEAGHDLHWPLYRDVRDTDGEGGVDQAWRMARTELAAAVRGCELQLGYFRCVGCSAWLSAAQVASIIGVCRPERVDLIDWAFSDDCKLVMCDSRCDVMCRGYTDGLVRIGGALNATQLLPVRTRILIIEMYEFEGSMENDNLVGLAEVLSEGHGLQQLWITLGTYENEVDDANVDYGPSVSCDDAELRALSAAVEKTGGVLQVQKHRHSFDCELRSGISAGWPSLRKHGLGGDREICEVAAGHANCSVGTIVAKWPVC